MTLASRVAGINSTVLIQGEKRYREKCYRQNIFISIVPKKLPVAVNCAALPAELMESELLVILPALYQASNKGRIGL